MKVLISGGSGLIGSALAEHLAAAGHEVARLVRAGAKLTASDVPWTPGQPFAAKSLEGMQAIVHLAGETVGQRWSAAVKEKILRSRVEGTRTLAEAVAAATRAGQKMTLVSASAIGFYGSRGPEWLTEESAPGEGFLADVCCQWEAAAEPARQAGARVVHPRIGLVLSRKGGALPRMLPAFRMGLAGRMGSGQQFWSWITLRDVVRALEFLLTNEKIAGAVNLTSPAPVTNAEFTRALGEALHRPTVLPMPAAVVRTLFGEMGEETILASQRVRPEQLLPGGFQFEDAEPAEAIRTVLAG